jgi:sugar lactone lactonase YvrE
MKELMSGLVVGESPRWHEGRLWFSNWGAQEIVALDLGGKSEVITQVPKFAGFCIDFLADGTLLVTGEDLILRLQNRELVPHIDLSALGNLWNEIVVDGRGNIYVNNIGFAFGEEEFKPGFIALVTPDGAVRKVADDIMFPNGMVVTPDNRTLIIAESWATKLTAFDIEPDGSLTNRRVWADIGGDGICLDQSGAIWCADMVDSGSVAMRVREGGEILQRLPLDAACFACALNDDGDLFLMVAEWRGVDRMSELFQSHTGRVLTTRV